jgi:hypothetical protein
MHSSKLISNPVTGSCELFSFPDVEAPSFVNLPEKGCGNLLPSLHHLPTYHSAGRPSSVRTLTVYLDGPGRGGIRLVLAPRAAGLAFSVDRM